MCPPKVTKWWCSFFQVSSKEIARFQTAYATVLKAHMDALKKKEKKDKKKTSNKPSMKRELT
jgi:hypothetical protein